VKDFRGSGNHFANFLHAVRSRKTSDLNCPAVEGHLSSALCHLGNISYQMGRQAPFNVPNKAFGDDIDAYEAFGRMEQHLADNPFKGEKKKEQEVVEAVQAASKEPKSETRPEHQSDNAAKKKEKKAPRKDPSDDLMKLQEMKYQMGPKLAFDPKAENFGSNQEANRLLTREYRAPFVVPDKV
jgi:hypothetical protein